MPTSEEAESSSAAAGHPNEDAALKRKRSHSPKDVRSKGRASVSTSIKDEDDIDQEITSQEQQQKQQQQLQQTTTELVMPHFQYVPRFPPRLKPGEELLDEATQAKILARRTRDAGRKWLQSQRVKFAAANGMVYSPRSSAPKTVEAGVTEMEEIEQDQSGTSLTSETVKTKPKPPPLHLERATSESAPSVPDAESAEENGDDEGDDEEDKPELYCICRSLADDDRMMIACDHCDQWFHVSCMKMNNEQADLIDIFVCPRCEPSTTERTTWKPPCARPACNKAARPPLARYCSDKCGILAAASRIAKTKHLKTPGGLDSLYSAQVRTARKREGLVLWGDEDHHNLNRTWFQALEALQLDTDRPKNSAVSPFPQLSRRATREEEDLVNLQITFASLQSRKQATSASLDLFMARSKLLELAYDRAGELPPAQMSDESAASNKKKSKGSKGGNDGDDSVKTQPRCGYDERLSWDDERFAAWMTSETGQQVLTGVKEMDGQLDDGNDLEADNEAMDVDDGQTMGAAAKVKICGLIKRKCRKHVDWSVVRGNDFDAEKSLQTATLSQLAEQELLLRARISELTARIEARNQYQDERLALSLARENTRMATTGGLNGKVVNGH